MGRSRRQKCCGRRPEPIALDGVAWTMIGRRRKSMGEVSAFSAESLQCSVDSCIHQCSSGTRAQYCTAAVFKVPFSRRTDEVATSHDAMSGRRTLLACDWQLAMCIIAMLHTSIKESSVATRKCRSRVRHFGGVFALPYKLAACYVRNVPSSMRFARHDQKCSDRTARVRAPSVWRRPPSSINMSLQTPSGGVHQCARS